MTKIAFFPPHLMTSGNYLNKFSKIEKYSCMYAFIIHESYVFWSCVHSTHVLASARDPVYVSP